MPALVLLQSVVILNHDSKHATPPLNTLQWLLFTPEEMNGLAFPFLQTQLSHHAFDFFSLVVGWGLNLKSYTCEAHGLTLSYRSTPSFGFLNITSSL
jgi:hypothetical protein